MRPILELAHCPRCGELHTEYEIRLFLNMCRDCAEAVAERLIFGTDMPRSTFPHEE